MTHLCGTRVYELMGLFISTKMVTTAPRIPCIKTYKMSQHIKPLSGPVYCQVKSLEQIHYDDVIMSTIASQITSLTIVYSTIYSGADQSKRQSSASLVFVWGIHRGPVNSPHKWPVTRKTFPFDDVIMFQWNMNPNAKMFYQESACEIVVCKILTILVRTQCVNSSLCHVMSCHIIVYKVMINQIISLTIFHHDSNLMKILFYSHPNSIKVISIKLCIWHNSYHSMCKMFLQNDEFYAIKIWIAMKKIMSVKQGLLSGNVFHNVICKMATMLL